MFDYEFLLGLYNEILGYNSIFYTITGLKIFAVAFLAVHYYLKFLKTNHQQPGEGKVISPITPHDIYVGIGYVVAIASFDQVLFVLDFVFESFSNIEALQSSIVPPPQDSVVPIDNEVSDQSNVAQLKVIADYIWTILNPLTWIGGATDFVTYIIDQFIFGWFLLNRFFVMGILRIVGPIALLMAIFPQTKGYFNKWLGLYIAQYLLVIPYFAITGFTNVVFEGMHDLVVFNAIPILYTLVGAFAVILKISLFVVSKRLITNIFS